MHGRTINLGHVLPQNYTLEIYIHTHRNKKVHIIPMDLKYTHAQFSSIDW